MKVKVGALWGQVVVKTEGLPPLVIEAMRELLNVPFNGETLLVGEQGSGAELFLALTLAKDAGADVRFKKECGDVAQIFMARSVLYYGLRSTTGYDGHQALVLRGNVPCIATWAKSIFFVGKDEQVTQLPKTCKIVCQTSHKGISYILAESA